MHNLSPQLSNFIPSSSYRISLQGHLLGIFSENRVEWCISELACIYYSFVSVPVHEGGMYIPFLSISIETFLVHHNNRGRIFAIYSLPHTPEYGGVQ